MLSALAKFCDSDSSNAGKVVVKGDLNLLGNIVSGKLHWDRIFENKMTFDHAGIRHTDVLSYGREFGSYYGNAIQMFFEHIRLTI